MEGIELGREIERLCQRMAECEARIVELQGRPDYGARLSSLEADHAEAAADLAALAADYAEAAQVAGQVEQAAAAEAEAAAQAAAAEAEEAEAEAEVEATTVEVAPAREHWWYRPLRAARA